MAPEPQAALETVGTSPKAIAAAITAGVAPIAVALIARLFDAHVHVNTVTAIVGPLALAGVTFLAARQAPPGLVVPHVDEPEPPDNGTTYDPGQSQRDNPPGFASPS